MHRVLYLSCSHRCPLRWMPKKAMHMAVIKDLVIPTARCSNMVQWFNHDVSPSHEFDWSKHQTSIDIEISRGSSVQLNMFILDGTWLANRLDLCVRVRVVGWIYHSRTLNIYIYIIYNILISLIYIYIARALQTVTPNHPCLLARYSLQDVMKGKEARKDILSCTTCWICWANSTLDLYS